MGYDYYRRKKLRPYLNYIKDTNTVISVARQICTTVKETMDRKPIDTTQNTLNFINNLYEKEFKKLVLRIGL